MKTDHQKRVEDFMIKAGQSIPTTPTIPDLETRKLRARLILEESLETIHALGCGISFEGGEISIQAKGECNMAEVVDGCCDILVVTTGTLSAFGIPDKPPQALVDRNNLAKFGPGGYRREDGKWIKPPDHQPPDIAGLLQRLTIHEIPTALQEKCSLCGNPKLQGGYGFAAGPLGSYQLCDDCEIVVSFRPAEKKDD